MFKLALWLVLGSFTSTAWTQPASSATNLVIDMYGTCLKDFSTSCIQPKALQWFNEVIQQDEILLTDTLSIVRTTRSSTNGRESRATNEDEQLFDHIDDFLETHALRLRAPEFIKSSEARALVPDFLWDNALTNDAVVPLATRSTSKGRGMVRKVVLPFLLGLKFKTMVLVPLALGLIALKTWKAMTLGLLSLVLSGALVIFKIAKPKIVNYEVVHYPPAHIEHLPHHVEHIVPHHIEHVPHHIELPHHVDHHVEHIEHAAPAWEPQAWSRSSVEPKDAQDLAYAGQNH